MIIERESREFLLNQQPSIATNANIMIEIPNNPHVIMLDNNNRFNSENQANLVIVNPIIHNNAANIDFEEQKIYSDWLCEFQMNCLFGHIFLALLFLHFIINLKYIYMFIPLFCWDLYDLVLIIKQIRKPSLRYIFI